MLTNKPDTLKQGSFGRIVSSCKSEANHTLEPDFQGRVGANGVADAFYFFREVFLKALIAYSFWP